jgi:hypothetical protein
MSNELDRKNARNFVADALKAAGFDPDEIENENLLVEASATEEELVAVSKICMERYEKNRDLADYMAVSAAKDALEGRGIVVDSAIKDFLKKNKKNIRS